MVSNHIDYLTTCAGRCPLLLLVPLEDLFQLLARIAFILWIQLCLVLQNLVDSPIELDELGRHSTADTIRRHRLRYYSPCRYSCSSADSYARQKCHIASYPYVFFNNNIMVKTTWFVCFIKFANKHSDLTRVIASVNSKSFCYNTMFLYDKSRIQSRDEATFYTSIRINKDILRIYHPDGGDCPKTIAT